MPRKHRHRHRTMRGGFLDTLSNWGSSLSQSASDLWQKTKNATSSATSDLTGSTSSTSSYLSPSTTSTSTTSNEYSQPMSTSTYGGKSRTKRRRMRGGFTDNTAVTGLAAHAAPFSGETAKPHTIVGGRTRRHKKHKHSKSCKHRKN